MQNFSELDYSSLRTLGTRLSEFFKTVLHHFRCADRYSINSVNLSATLLV